MKKICFKEFCLLKICVLFIISGLGKAQADDHQCIPGFKPHKIPSTYGSKVNVCSNVFLDKKSWNDASAICKINFSYLTDKIYFNSSLHAELANKSIDLLWVGIRRRSNYFVANDTELFEEKENVWGFHWSAGEPRRSDCVALNLTSGSLSTHNCRKELPFVCENSGISDVYNASLPYLSCPEYWVLSIPLASSGRKCSSSVIGPLSQPDAENFCEESYGRLATIQEYDVLHSANYLSASSEDIALWVNKQGYESCPFKVIPAVNGSSTKERPRNCSMPLPFICIKDYEIDNVDVWIGESGVSSNKTFPRTSSCGLEDILTCNINVTANNIEQRQLFRWYKDDIPISSCTSYTCRVGFTKASLKWDRYTYAGETRQGSYHCEVSFYGLTKKYTSPKTNIFFSDIATYVVDINGIDLNSFVDYSHHNFEKKMKELNSTIFKLFEKLNFQHLDAMWDLQSISVAGKSATMKILIYIHRTSIRGFEDEEMYDEIKKLFAENASEFQYKGNIFLTINSADVCFHREVELNDTCSNKLTWLTTRQATNVISTATCLDDNNNPVYRGCKASSVSKAEWSTFNCSSCKKFHDRFHGLPFHCPEGYSKIKGKNICFKLFREKKNWYEAYEICSGSSSYLANEEFDDIGPNEIWLSYKYSYGKIQDVGMRPVKLKFEKTIAENHEFHCISAVFENNVYKLRLKDCDEKISFACILNPYELVSSVKFSHTWTKVHTQDACYYFDRNISYSWTESRETCKQTFHGADILHGILRVEDYSYLKKVIHEEFQETNCQPLSWWMNYTDGYTANMNYLDLSPYIDSKKTHGSLTMYPDRRIYWTSDNFDSNLKLACEIEKCGDNRPTQAYIEDRNKATDSSSFGDYHTYINNFKLKCIPSGWFIKNSMHWFKDGVLLDVSSSELSFDIPSTVSTHGVLEYQGYYSCSVDQFHPIKRVYSSDYLLKIPGIHTFVLSMTSQNKVYLMECPKYMFDQKSYEGSSLKACFDDYFHSTLNSPNFHLRNVTCNRTHVIITVHVHFEVGEEEILLNDIQNASFDNFCKICDIDHNVSVLSTVSCYRETKKLKDIDVTWPTTPVGKIAYPEQMCLTEDGKLLERRCLGDFNSGAHWSDTPTGECSTTKSDITKELFLLRNEATADSFVSLSSLPSLTASPEELKPADVQLIAQIFENLADQQTLTTDKLDIVVSTMNNLVDAKPEIFNEVENSSNQIIENFEHITSVVDLKENVNINTGNIIVDIYPLYSDFLAIPNCKILSNGFTRSLFNATEKDLEDNNNIEAGIVLPNNLILENSNTSDRLVYAVYKKNFIQSKNLKALSYLIHASLPNTPVYDLGKDEVILFFKLNEDLEDNNNIEAGIVLPNNLIIENSNTSDRLVYAVYKKNFIQSKNLKALSYLIHASLPNTPVYDLGKDEVIRFFKLNEKIDLSANATPKCVFWDHNLNSWSYKGCFPRYINESSVLCVCNHLTSFSVVMEIDSTPIPPHHKIILHFITYIGCSLSCIGYCLILMTFICFREWRKSLKNKALFNFSISQFLFLFIFMAAIDQTSCKAFCKVAAILLHYFLLSSFTWMIVLAYTVYLSLVKVLDTYIPCLIQKFIAFAWGVPAVILIAVLSCNHEYYSREDVCWLSKDVIIYGIIIPLAVMLVVNFIIFGTIFHVNICKRPYLRINQNRRKLVIARAKALLCTSILLGLSWIFGFLAVGEAKLIFEYLFSITTPLQGFLLAVFFVIRPKSTRGLWLRLFCSSSSYKSSPSHTISSMIISQRVDVGRRSKYENMINSVVYKVHSPYTPYA